MQGEGAPELASGASWTELDTLIRGCTACELHRSRHNVVIFRGSRHPRVLFIGEAPGAQEDQAGVPFVGAAGRRLDAAVADLGLTPAEWAVINLVKCRPPQNEFRRRWADRCRPFLDRQIAILDPRWIVTLGRHALATVDPGASPLTAVTGSVRPLGPRQLVPLLHPAAVLHDPRRRARWDSDLGRLRAALSSTPETL